jgi:hypothetical protein
MMEKWKNGMMGRKWMTFKNIPIFQHSNIPIIYIMFKKNNHHKRRWIFKID